MTICLINLRLLPGSFPLLSRAEFLAPGFCLSIFCFPLRQELRFGLCENLASIFQVRLCFQSVLLFSIFSHRCSFQLHHCFSILYWRTNIFSSLLKVPWKYSLEFQVSKNQLIHTPWLPTVRKKSRKNKFLRGQGKSEFHLVFTSSREFGQK